MCYQKKKANFVEKNYAMAQTDSKTDYETQIKREDVFTGMHVSIKKSQWYRKEF